MTKYIIQRILAMLVTLVIIVTIGFMVIRLMPGGIFDDAVDMTYEQREALEAKYFPKDLCWRVIGEPH